MYIFDGKDALIYWIFTISENIFQHFKGVVYKVKNHTEWTVFAVDDNRTGMRSVKAPYNGRVSVEDTGKLKIVNCTSSDTATYKIVVQLSIFNDVERAFRLTVLGTYERLCRVNTKFPAGVRQLFSVHCYLDSDE